MFKALWGVAQPSPKGAPMRVEDLFDYRRDCAGGSVLPPYGEGRLTAYAIPERWEPNIPEVSITQRGKLDDRGLLAAPPLVD